MVSQQLTATSSRDDVAALDTSGEDDCTAIVKDLQLCVVMVREALIKLLGRVSSSMLCNSPERDSGMMRVIPLDRAQVIVPIPVHCAETGFVSPPLVVAQGGDWR